MGSSQRKEKFFLSWDGSWIGKEGLEAPIESGNFALAGNQAYLIPKFTVGFCTFNRRI